jgi:MFS family permease
MRTAFINRFLTWLTVGISTSVLSLLLLSKGCGLGSLGLVMAVYSGAAVLLELPSGILSDRLGRRAIYLVSLILSFIGYALLIFVSSLPGLALACAFLGAGKAFSSGSIESVYIQEYLYTRGQEGLQRLMSVMSAGETLGLALGALVGGLLPGLWERLCPGTNRYNGNLFVQILLQVLLFFLTLVMTHEDNGDATASCASTDERSCCLSSCSSEGLSAHLRSSMRLLKTNRIVSSLLAASLVWGFSFSAVEIFWQPRLTGILGTGSGTGVFGIVEALYFLASLLGVAIAGRFSGKSASSDGRLLFALRLCLGGFLCLLATRGSGIAFCGIYLSLAFSNGLSSVPESTAFNKAIPEERRSTFLSLSSLAVQAGGALASVALGSLVGFLGISTLWLLCGILLALSSPLYLRLH